MSTGSGGGGERTSRQSEQCHHHTLSSENMPYKTLLPPQRVPGVSVRTHGGMATISELSPTKPLLSQLRNWSPAGGLGRGHPPLASTRYIKVCELLEHMPPAVRVAFCAFITRSKYSILNIMSVTITRNLLQQGPWYKGGIGKIQRHQVSKSNYIIFGLVTFCDMIFRTTIPKVDSSNKVLSQCLCLDPTFP